MHETSCRCIEYGATYEQHDLPALASFELIGRQVQLIEVKQGDGGSDLYMFTGASSRAAEEVRKESAVMKERRKARELWIGLPASHRM